MTPPQNVPLDGFSVSIPEENIVNLDDDSSMSVIPLEDFSVGQDMEVKDSDTDDLDPVQA